MKVIPERRFINEDLAQQIREKCGNVCAVCGTSKHLQYDHIIPVSEGGKTELGNMQLLCKTHNYSKRTDFNKDSNSKIDNTGNTLTPKVRAFCKEYIIDYNGQQAAVRAGYSEISARESACEHLAKSNVQAYVTRLEEEKNIERDLTAGFILNGLRNIAATADRPADQVRAYELLGKHRKLFTEQLDITGTAKIIREEIRHKEE